MELAAPPRWSAAHCSRTACRPCARTPQRSHHASMRPPRAGCVGPAASPAPPARRRRAESSASDATVLGLRGNGCPFGGTADVSPAAPAAGSALPSARRPAAARRQHRVAAPRAGRHARHRKETTSPLQRRAPAPAPPVGAPDGGGSGRCARRAAAAQARARRPRRQAVRRHLSHREASSMGWPSLASRAPSRRAASAMGPQCALEGRARRAPSGGRASAWRG